MIYTHNIDLLFKHKHLVKEYSDQKSTMTEIEKKIILKESEWQSKFQEFASNANKLEAQHSRLEYILNDYYSQYKGIISICPDATKDSDHPLPFLELFGSLQKFNSSLDHSLQHATAALNESQRVTNQALQNIDLKSNQISILEREIKEIQSLVLKYKAEISCKEKEMSTVMSDNLKLNDKYLKISEKIKRIMDAYKWTMI